MQDIFGRQPDRTNNVIFGFKILKPRIWSTESVSDVIDS